MSLSGIDITPDYNPYQDGVLSEADKGILNTHISLLRPYLSNDCIALDAGCGLGQASHKLSDFCMFVIGVDASSNNIMEAKRINSKANIHYVVGDVSNLHYPDCLFDIIIVSELIEHIPDYQRMIKELKRLGADNCVYSLSTPNLWIWFFYPSYLLYALRHPRKALNILRMRPIDAHHFDRWLSPFALRKTIEASNFKIIAHLTDVYFAKRRGFLNLLDWLFSSIYILTPFKRFVGLRQFILFIK